MNDDDHYKFGKDEAERLKADVENLHRIVFGDPTTAKGGMANLVDYMSVLVIGTKEEPGLTKRLNRIENWIKAAVIAFLTIQGLPSAIQLVKTLLTIKP